MGLYSKGNSVFWQAMAVNLYHILKGQALINIDLEKQQSRPSSPATGSTVVE